MPFILFMLLLAGPAIAGDGDETVFLAEHVERHFDHKDAMVDLEFVHGNAQRKFVAKFSTVMPDHYDLEAALRLTYARPVNDGFDWHVGFIAESFGTEYVAGLTAGINGETRFGLEAEIFVALNEDDEFLTYGDLKRDFALTEKLIIKPVVGFLAGHGDDAIFAEARLRYQMSDNFAPYVGILWEEVYGEADISDSSALLGITFSF